MATQKTFQEAYRRALKALAKEKRVGKRGKLPASERRTIRWEAQTRAQEAEIAQRGSVVRDVTRNPNPYGYVIALDKFMSGWGHAPGRSLFAVAVENPEESLIVEQNMKHRQEMKRVRFQSKLPRVSRGDHLSVTDKKSSPRFFKSPYEGGFATK